MKDAILGARGKRRDRRREDRASASLGRQPQGSRILFSYPYGQLPARPERRSERRSSLGELRSSGPAIARPRADHIGQRGVVRRTLDRHPHVGAESNRDRCPRGDRRWRWLRRHGSHGHRNESGRTILRGRQLLSPTIQEASINAGLLGDLGRIGSRLHQRCDPPFLFRARPSAASFDRCDDLDPVHGTVAIPGVSHTVLRRAPSIARLCVPDGYTTRDGSSQACRAAIKVRIQRQSG